MHRTIGVAGNVVLKDTTIVRSFDLNNKLGENVKISLASHKLFNKNSIRGILTKRDGDFYVGGIYISEKNIRGIQQIPKIIL